MAFSYPIAYCYVHLIFLMIGSFGGTPTSTHLTLLSFRGLSPCTHQFLMGRSGSRWDAHGESHLQPDYIHLKVNGVV